MGAKKRLAVLLCLVLFVPAALSQGPRRPPREHDARDFDAPPPPPPAGIWPTDRMMYLFIDRMTEELGKTYGFDEEQLHQTRELWKDEFPVWLNEHREEIQQLTNEYIEALLDDKPPDPEFVADWAQRVLPLVDEFAERCETVGEQMRPFLTEDQQLTLDGQLAGFRVGMKYLNQRLVGWAEGGFDAETEWHRSPAFKPSEDARNTQIAREAQEAEIAARGGVPKSTGEAGGAAGDAAEAARDTGRSAASSRPAGDDWAKYVEDFIRRYQLNAEQQATAHKYLRTLQDRRDAFLRRNASELEKARRAAANPRSEAQRSRAEEQLQRLNRPLDNMFTQLKEKLDSIPTRKQRAEAGGKAEAQDKTRGASAVGKAVKP